MTLPPRIMSTLTLVSQWCIAELKSAAPWIEKVLLDPQPRALILDGPDRTTVVLEDVDTSELCREVFTVPLDQFSSEQGEHLLELCAKRELSLSVAVREILCLQLQVPKNAMSNLRKSLKYRLLTESPLGSDSMLFDARLLHADAGRGVVTAEIVLCRRQSLDRLRACAERLRLVSPHIGLTRVDGVALEFTFEPARGVRTASSRLRRNILLALGPVLICIFTLFASWAYASWKEADLRKDIAALSSRTDESIRLLARQAHVRTISKAINSDLPKTALSQMLNDISKTLPTSAWLSEIRIDGDKLRLIGNAADPTTVAKDVAATAGLAAVRLDSVASGAAILGPSRFEITAEIAAGRKN